jgi:Trk-type K+ transport system membrane component
VGQWVLTILIAGIPIVGLVMIFVWAFSGNTNINKSNWAKATLIWIVVGIIIGGAILSITGAAFLANAYDF